MDINYFSEIFQPFPELPDTDHVHVWWVNAKDLSDVQLDTFEGYLTEEQRARAATLEEQERIRYVLSKTILPFFYQQYLNERLDRLEVEKNSYGKPYLKNKAFQFNLTHTEGQWLFALHREAELGVDMEMLDRVIYRENDYVEKLLGDVDRDDFDNLSTAEKKELLLDRWTRYQARLKARGIGSAFPWEKIDLDEVETHKLDAPEGFIAYLAMEYY